MERIPGTNKIEMGREYNFDFDDRYFLQTAEATMKSDIIRGLVELTTNCDDSYSRLEEDGTVVNGEIQISIERKRKKNSVIKVLDNAEGMGMDEMVTKLKRLGGATSGFLESRGRVSRGLMGRGSKECVIFGNLTYQSIKDNFYSELELRKPTIFKPICENKATKIERINTEIEEGNGTLVTLEVESQFKIPSHDQLIKNFPKYFSLRDITSSPNRRLILVDASCPSEKKRELSYHYPMGEMVFDDKIDIPGYPEAEAHLSIKKSPNRIPCNSTSPYWEGGILVKSKKAIHEVTSLSKKIENNPYFEFYFGKLTCPYIDDLTYEFEEIERKKGRHSDSNPSRIIDPLRSEGLVKNHPFTKSLYNETAKCIEILLRKDEEGAKQETREIENKKTKDRFKKLTSEASKFIQNNVEDIDIDDENYLTPSEIQTGGMIVIPGGLKILINQESKIYIYTRPSLEQLEQKERHVMTTNDSDSIKLRPEIVGLTDRGDGIYVGIISIMGIKEGLAKVKLSWGNISKHLAVIVTAQKELPQNMREFQFEKDNYTVKEGKNKNIRIFAQWPEFIHGRVKIKISLKETEHCKLLTENIILDYDRKSKEAFGRTLATGVVKISGLKTGGPVVLNATLQDREISTKIRVAPKKELGKNFEIKIVDEDLGDQRAVLIGGVMKINGRHRNIKRYLGPPEMNFMGQDSIHFRLLIAELIADTVARRILELNAQKNVSEYKSMDVTSFYREHRKYMNNFLEIAHKIQIPDGEI